MTVCAWILLKVLPAVTWKRYVLNKLSPDQLRNQTFLNYMSFLNLRFAIYHIPAAFAFLLAGTITASAESGESVVLIYNANVPDSKKVADHYAKRRNVPEQQVLGLELPTGETMSREDYVSNLQKPLFRFLEKQNLFKIKAETTPATNGASSKVIWAVKEAKVRYAVLCYGVPTRILEEPGLQEEGRDKLPELLRKNGAAVDSELALLPMQDQKLALYGTLLSPYYASTNPASLNPVNGLLMVARLDGPSADLARGLVDKAIEAEERGLWGHAYFDQRNITEGEYKLGDQIIEAGADATRKLGWETILDNKPETLSSSATLSHVGFYAGWYDEHVSGPFTLKNVEFMPGAFAYHIHSYSAATVRSPTKHWVGPLIAKGVTATIGYVDEPFLMGTIDVGVLADRLLRGFSFGEAAYASQNGLSWQTTVVGDPLYRPAQRRPEQQHEIMQMRNDPLLEWSHLRMVNMNILVGNPVSTTIEYLEKEGAKSAVLMEKLGDVYLGEGKTWQAINAYAQALNLKPSYQQEIRLLLTLADKFAAEKRPQESLNMLKLLIKKAPDYPDLPKIQERIATLARK
jgi:uncharacterized protein (TIGR03790 family)